jgi:hypothetical protein
MNLAKIEFDGMNLVQLAQDKFRPVVNTITNLRIPYRQEISCSADATLFLGKHCLIVDFALFSHAFL